MEIIREKEVLVMFTRRRNRSALYIILPLLLITGFSVSYFLSYDGSRQVKHRPTTERNQAVETAPLLKEVIEPGAKIIYERLYRSCNEIYTDEDDVSTEYVGLTEEEFAKAYKGWVIKSFSPTEVHLYREEDGYCPRHYIIGEKDGYVVVYKNDPDRGMTPVQFTDIQLISLRREYQENIREGIVVDSEERVYQILAEISS